VGTSVALLLLAFIELGICLPILLRSNGLPFISRTYPRFLVLGDWGRDGDYNQSVVAQAMARKAKSLRPNFVISTGDNFYEWGLVSVDDPQFDTSFVDIYNQSELQIPWHAVLGNHDYGETDKPEKPAPFCSLKNSEGEGNACFFSPLHQLDIALSARDPRWHCERAFTLTLAGGDIEFFFIDTTPIMSQYMDAAWAINRGGVLQQSYEDASRELEGKLARSKAKWKLVVGHHPIRSNHRSDDKFSDMVDIIEPLLVRYGVQAYFCGHDHNLQYIYNPNRGYHHVTSGAGSAIGDGFSGHHDSPFQYAGNGFVAVTMGPRAMKVEYLGVDSDEPLFSVTVPRDI